MDLTWICQPRFIYMVLIWQHVHSIIVHTVYSNWNKYSLCTRQICKIFVKNLFGVTIATYHPHNKAFWALTTFSLLLPLFTITHILYVTYLQYLSRFLRVLPKFPLLLNVEPFFWKYNNYQLKHNSNYVRAFNLCL